MECEALRQKLTRCEDQADQAQTQAGRKSKSDDFQGEVGEGVFANQREVETETEKMRSRKPSQPQPSSLGFTGDTGDYDDYGHGHGQDVMVFPLAGQVYHKPSCKHVRSRASATKSYKACVDCFGTGCHGAKNK